MKIHIICVAYERVEPLEILIRSFIVQTNKNWILHIVYDGTAPKKILDIIAPFLDGSRKDERIHFYQSPERNQKYGHPNRRTMLKSIETNQDDFILMTNDDNYYIPRFIEFMLRQINPRVGMVYCDTVHSHAEYDINYSELRENCVDLGAFIVRATIAKETGFNHDHFSADGTYAEECLKTCHKKGLIAIKIKKALFVHN